MPSYLGHKVTKAVPAALVALDREAAGEAPPAEAARLHAKIFADV
jgi:hypothetical protein